jgi:hypothetical protein
VKVTVFRSTGKHPHNMELLKKLRFWKKKKNTSTPTTVDACVSTSNPWTGDAATECMDPTFMCVSTHTVKTRMDGVDACVSTEQPRTCDAATVSMAPTVMCVSTQTEETRMDGRGGAAAAAAAKQVCEDHPESYSQKIRKLEEELVVTKRFTADLMLNVKSVEQQIRKYAVAPVIMSSDDCECRRNVSAVADLLKNFIITEDARKSKQGAKDTNKSRPEARDTKKSKPDATSGGTTKVDNEMQTEPNSRQRDYASVVKQGNVRRLDDEKRKLSELVEDYERKIVLLNEEMESILQDRTSHIQHIKMMYKEENQRQILKMRDMRDELIWYKKRLPGVRMPTGQ